MSAGHPRYDGQVNGGEGRSGLYDWIGLLARLVLGGSLLVAGLLKVTNLEANVLSVRAYQLHFIPYELQKAIGYAQPFVEILVGALIVVGLFTRASAALGTLAMLVFIVGIASLWARGLSVDCGCFSKGGATDDPHYLREIIRDTVFALCGLWLLWRPRSRFSADAALFPPIPELDFDQDDHDEPALVGEDHRA